MDVCSTTKNGETELNRVKGRSNSTIDRVGYSLGVDCTKVVATKSGGAACYFERSEKKGKVTIVYTFDKDGNKLTTKIEEEKEIPGNLVPRAIDPKAVQHARWLITERCTTQK